ncbi:hypothetical protein HED60_03915 [Planctomycetales bacterium ZRK34]|nr:hypothetical protein HED60_03915 [Planctomycetales bacterium ZRK34]
MALIKSHQAQDLAHDAIVLDLGDLRRQARVLIDRANVEAQRIVDEGKAKAEAMTADADQRGYDAGYARGESEGRTAGEAAGRAEALAAYGQQLQQLQQAWISAAQQWDADRRTMLIEARQSLLTLAIQMAEKIVRRVPEVDPSIVVDQVAEAVAYVARPCDVTVRIHPEDRPLLDDAMPALVRQLGQVEHAALVDDDMIQRGGCVVTYGQGRIDATLNTQLDRLVDTLMPKHGDSQNTPQTDTPDTPDPQPPTPEA